MITSRALGVYYYLVNTKSTISADALSKVFPEGRKIHLRTLKELRDLELIRTSRQVVNGKFVTQSYLNLGSPISELLLQQSRLNPNNNLLLDINTDLLNHKQNSNADALHGGSNMDWDDFAPMYVDPEDRDRLLQKKREMKHQEKMEQHERIRGERMKRREDSNRVNWSPTDVAFEFGHRMQLLWHVAPWQVTRSRFRFALDKKRSEYNTTGDLECQMMDIYFDKIKQDTRLNDPEIIWKKFIVDFGSLFLQVTRQSATPEQIDTERERSQRSVDKLRNLRGQANVQE